MARHQREIASTTTVSVLLKAYADIRAESVTYDSGNHDGKPDLRFIHYNDVYHVEAGSAEPVGGIARFKTLCSYYQNDNKFKDQSELLNFFSGDAFNPSLESSVTKGTFANLKSGRVTVPN